MWRKPGGVCTLRLSAHKHTCPYAGAVLKARTSWAATETQLGDRRLLNPVLRWFLSPLSGVAPDEPRGSWLPSWELLRAGLGAIASIGMGRPEPDLDHVLPRSASCHPQSLAHSCFKLPLQYHEYCRLWPFSSFLPLFLGKKTLNKGTWPQIAAGDVQVGR